MIELPNDGIFVGRVWRTGVGPSVVTLRDGHVYDVTSRTTPTMRDLLEQTSVADFLADHEGENLGSLSDLAEATWQGLYDHNALLLAPCDLQAIKACGVTFARSMIERVIEESARGDPSKASDIRARVMSVVGESLHNLRPGSNEANKVRAMLQKEGLWSQYLEVGIGPDAEVFTKSQAMSAVGWGADVGLHPISQWNNPEPEVVLAVSSKGRIVGATLGNDVNLRDVEGRSALLLGKAKDNNASAAIGPFIRIFDETFDLDDTRKLNLAMTVEGEDGFTLEGTSSMREISRDPEDLVRQTCGRHHQYPDGFMLYLGTLFAPTQDRDAPGQGFTHHIGDVVTISTPALGSLVNRVNLSTEAPEWSFGTGALMRNLAERNLL